MKRLPPLLSPLHRARQLRYFKTGFTRYASREGNEVGTIQGHFIPHLYYLDGLSDLRDIPHPVRRQDQELKQEREGRNKSALVDWCFTHVTRTLAWSVCAS